MNRTSFFFAFFFGSTAALVPVAGFAQESYKCKINGTMVYQDRPCPGSVRRSESMPLPKPAATAAAATAPAPTPEPVAPAISDTERQKAFLAKGAKERRISDLQYEIGRTEATISRLHGEMADKIAEIDREKLRANNNLAGATFLNSLATEQQAITTRYQVDISTQRDRLKTLQEKLVAAKQE